MLRGNLSSRPFYNDRVVTLALVAIGVLGLALAPAAMAAECPVVAARATSIPEVVGDAAELFDPTSPAALAAAIEHVADDEAWRATLRARGLRRAREFSAARMT